MLKFLKNWTLPIAMLLGGIGYPLFIRLSFLTPALIFTMLLLTFCKVSPRDLRPKPLHLWLLLIQIFGSIAVYLLLFRFNKIVAEGAMVCIICPTATAAAVITSKLGGSAASLTTYTLIGNIGAAVAVPVLWESWPKAESQGRWRSAAAPAGRRAGQWVPLPAPGSAPFSPGGAACAPAGPTVPDGSGGGGASAAPLPLRFPPFSRF